MMIGRENIYMEAKHSSQLDLVTKKYWQRGEIHRVSEKMKQWWGLGFFVCLFFN